MLDEKIMTLREWLTKNGLRQADFGLMLGVPQQYVSRYMLDITPPLEKILKIQELTNGEVRPEDFTLVAKYEGDKRLFEAGYLSERVFESWVVEDE